MLLIILTYIFILQNCEGNLQISYSQENTESIPYDKIITDVKNQINDIYKTSDVVENENVFTAKVKFNDELNIDLLYNNKWKRNGEQVNREDSSSLCGCGSSSSSTSSTTTGSFLMKNLK